MGLVLLPPHQDLCYDPSSGPQGTCDRRVGDGPSVNVVTPVKPDPIDNGGDTDGDNDHGNDDDDHDDSNPPVKVKVSTSDGPYPNCPA